VFIVQYNRHEIDSVKHVDDYCLSTELVSTVVTCNTFSPAGTLAMVTGGL
jgi:hypothetical protein